MKRCPECRRNYYDETLLYCLDDGTPLLEGPVSQDGPATAILPEQVPGGLVSSESPTVRQIKPSAAESNLARNRYILGGLLLLMITVAAGSYGYRYFTQAKQLQSIAVMPFVNESGTPDIEYLSDGMTETLISRLSQLANLSVRARSSVFRYKSKATDLRTIARELDVQAILTGKIVQRGTELSVYVEMVDVESDRVIWSETYERPVAQLTLVQKEIARDVTRNLRTKLSGGDEEELAKTFTDNAEAYQLYLKGRFHWNKRTDEDLQKSITYFEQAIAVDPGFAQAYSGLADAYALTPFYGDAKPHDAMPKAREAALQALSLDAKLAEAHATLGLILDDYDYDFAGAERAYKRAIELNPAYVSAHQWYSELLTHLGKHDESIAEMRQALKLDPVSLIVNKGYGDSLYFAKRYDEAIKQFEKTLDLYPGVGSPHRVTGYVFEMKGEYARAVEEFAKSHELAGRPELAASIRADFARGGWQGYLRSMLQENRSKNQPSYIAARYHAALGEKDQAFAELNKAYEKREFYIVLLKVDPSLDPLRDDPRLDKLLRQVGFPS